MSPKAIFLAALVVRASPLSSCSCSWPSSFIIVRELLEKLCTEMGRGIKKTTGGPRRLFGCRFCRLLALESRWGISLGRFGFCFMALAEVLSAVPCVAGSVVGGVLLLWRRLCRRSCGFGQVPGRLLCLAAFPVAVVFVCSFLRYSRCERRGALQVLI